MDCKNCGKKITESDLNEFCDACIEAHDKEEQAEHEAELAGDL